jgi:IS5 family transposase
MRQQTFAEGTFEVYAKPTRRAAFLADMERVVSWSELCAVIAHGAFYCNLPAMSFTSSL